MYSALQRINVLFTFCSSALIVALLVIAAMNNFMPCPEPTVRLAVNKIALYMPRRVSYIRN